MYLKVDQVNWYIKINKKDQLTRDMEDAALQDCAYSNSPEIQFKTGSGVSHKSNANYVRLQS